MRLCKSSLTTKLVLLGLMLYAIVTLAVLQPKIDALTTQRSELSRTLAYMEQNNADLKDDIRALGSDASVIQIAHERLQLVFEDEILFINGK